MFNRLYALGDLAKNFYRNRSLSKTHKIMRLAAIVIEGGVIIMESLAVGFIHFAKQPVKPYFSLLAFLNASPITNTLVAKGSAQLILQTVNCGVTSTATMLSLLEDENFSWDVVKSTLDYQTFFKVMENVIKYQQNVFTSVDFFDCGIVAVKNLLLKKLFSYPAWQDNKFFETPDDMELHFLIVFSWVFLMLDLVWRGARAVQIKIEPPVMHTLFYSQHQERLDELNNLKNVSEDYFLQVSPGIHP